MNISIIIVRLFDNEQYRTSLDQVYCTSRRRVQYLSGGGDIISSVIGSKREKMPLSRIKGSQLDAFSPYAIVYFYLEFNLSYLKNLKLFSIRVK